MLSQISFKIKRWFLLVLNLCAIFYTWNMSDDKKPPVVRLCHILKWSDFDGYGFNLHGEKGKTGQYIGKIDKGSPAEAAGLKEGDHIIEVNSVNICNENHYQVVQRIKAVPDETKLLVVDSASEEFYKRNNIPITSSLLDIVHIKTPVTNINSNQVENSSEEVDLVSLIVFFRIASNSIFWYELPQDNEQKRLG